MSESAWRLAFAVAALAGTGWALAAHLAIADLDGNPGARFLDQAQGRANRPYAYRVLAPGVVGLLDRVVPETLTDRLGALGLTQAVLDHHGWSDGPARPYLLALLTMWGGLLLFAAAARALFAAFVPTPWPERLVLAGLLLLPGLYAQYGYLYDFLQLGAFTLGLVLLSRERWRAHALVYPLLCLSKETSLLLLLPLWLESRRLPLRSRAGWLVLHAAIWLAVRAALVAALRGRPGSIVELHLRDNNLPLWRGLLAGDGWPAACALAVLVSAIAWRWGRKPPFLRRCLWMAAPLGLAAAFFGYFEERRQYMELFAPVLGLVASGVVPLRRQGRV